MFRNELNYSDNQLIDFFFQGYGIRATRLNFVDIGSFFGFIVETKENNKFFLKIYPKDQSLIPIHPSIESLNNMGNALQRFRDEFGLINISYCIPNRFGKFCYEQEQEELLLITYEFIEGYHPSYSPNQLTAVKLAKIFSCLHQIPPEGFPYFEKENFDIRYASELSLWLDKKVLPKDQNNHLEILNFLNKHQEKLQDCIIQLKNGKEKFSNNSLDLVITHGDAHHYNVLQTHRDLWLVDWDSLRIAPIERDLWHYENSPLIDHYCTLNPDYQINTELCEYYRLQRFLEDCHFYLDHVLLNKNATEEQSELDKQSFLNHWGWTLCV